MKKASGNRRRKLRSTAGGGKGNSRGMGGELDLNFILTAFFNFPAQSILNRCLKLLNARGWKGKVALEMKCLSLTPLSTIDQNNSLLL